jgi:hypothetical protein
MYAQVHNLNTGFPGVISLSTTLRLLHPQPDHCPRTVHIQTADYKSNADVDTVDSSTSSETATAAETSAAGNLESQVCLITASLIE